MMVLQGEEELTPKRGNALTALAAGGGGDFGRHELSARGAPVWAQGAPGMMLQRGFRLRVVDTAGGR